MNETCPVCGNELAPDAAACPACGFKVLGTTQKFQPLDMHGSASPKPSIEDREAVLRVVRGPQTGMAFRLSGDRLTVGRSPQCDVFLNDMTVSRSHATIERAGEGFVITDDNSFNGVWVNNENKEAHELKAGDIVQIGAFCLVYQDE